MPLPAVIGAVGSALWTGANVAATGYGLYQAFFGDEGDFNFPSEIQLKKPEYESPTRQQLDDMADQQWQAQLRSDYWNRDRIATAFAREQLDRFAYRSSEEAKERWVNQGLDYAERNFPTLSEAVSPASLRENEIELTGRKDLL